MYPSRHYIVALVPEPLATQIASLRKQYDTFTRQWLPPHVTIVPPFELFLTSQEIDWLRNFSVQCAATLDQLGAYRRTQSDVLFYQLLNHSFGQVRRDLLQALPRLAPLVEPDPTYHVTVVSRIPHERFDEIEQQVKQHAVQGTFTVERLMLYRWDDFVRRWIAITM